MGINESYFKKLWISFISNYQFDYERAVDSNLILVDFMSDNLTKIIKSSLSGMGYRIESITSKGNALAIVSDRCRHLVYGSYPALIVDCNADDATGFPRITYQGAFDAHATARDKNKFNEVREWK